MKTNKPKTKIITGCNDCPFCVRDTEQAEHYCILKSESELESFSFNEPITPQWCPLKTQPIIVTYET